LRFPAESWRRRAVRRGGSDRRSRPVCSQCLCGMHSSAGARPKTCILAAALFAAPHSSYYDSILLATAAVLWVAADAKDGRTLWRWECGLFAWAAPFFEMIVKKGFMPWLTAAFIAVMMIDYYCVSRPKAWSLPEAPSD